MFRRHVYQTFLDPLTSDVVCYTLVRLVGFLLLRFFGFSQVPNVRRTFLSVSLKQLPREPKFLYKRDSNSVELQSQKVKDLSEESLLSMAKRGVQINRKGDKSFDSSPPVNSLLLGIKLSSYADTTSLKASTSQAAN